MKNKNQSPQKSRDWSADKRHYQGNTKSLTEDTKNQEELKTLKDMGGWVDKNHIVINPNPMYHNEVVRKDELKELIIKWVKVEDWEDFWKWLLNKKGIRFGDCVGVELACYLLEYIFNLTGEDLKNE